LYRRIEAVLLIAWIIHDECCPRHKLLISF
jgi:hypothetical protein